MSSLSISAVHAGLTDPIGAPPLGAGQAPHLDAFAQQAGPDVKVSRPEGVVATHAIYSVDTETNQLRVAVVDDMGRLIRVIPPDSVADMLRMMASYAGI